jgi:hypothetical protein
MLTRGEDEEAHALRKRGWSYSAIARHLGGDRRTVEAYLNDGREPGRRRRSTADSLERFVPYLRERFTEDPHVWASALFDEVVALGYERSYRMSCARSVSGRCARTARRVGGQGSGPGDIDHRPGQELLCGSLHRNSYVRPGICGVEPGDRQRLSLVTVVRSSERAHASAAANGGRRFFFLEFRKEEAMVMEGPLAPWAAGMAGRLKTLGHAPSTAARHMQLGGRLSRFLQQRRLETSELNAGVLEEFFEDLHAYHGSS